MKLKQVCSIYGDYGLNIAADSYVDHGLPLIRTSDFDDLGRLDLNAAKYVSEDDAIGKILQPGDLLFSRSGTVGRCMVFNNDTRATYAAYLVRFRPRSDKAASRYIFYWSQSEHLKQQVRKETIESTIGNFNGSKFSNLNFPNIGLEAQKKIANFLDREIARVDQLIEKKERFLKLLDEKEFALVSYLLTHGVKTGIPTKIAGVPWMDVIPAHWIWARMKDVCIRIIDCKNRTPPEVDESEYFVVRTSCIRSGSFAAVGGYWTDKASFEEWTKRGIPQLGDILFTREAPMGEACLVPENLNFCLGQRMMIYRPNPSMIDPRYVVRMIYSAIGRSYIEAKGKGSTVGHLRVPEVYEFPCLLPPLGEQLIILGELDRRIGPYDALKTAGRTSIKRLNEFRAALITAAVTGQIDIGTWGKLRTTDRRLDSIEADMAVAAQPIRKEARG